MPGYRYEILLHNGELIEHADYWSAYRLRPGSKILLGDRLLVVEETGPAARGDVDFVARCRRAREDERFD